MTQANLYQNTADEPKADPLRNLAKEGVSTQGAKWRRMCERYVELAAHLEPDDEILIDSIFGQGLPVAFIARMSGQSPGRIRRKVKKLVTRMESPMFQFVAGGLDLLPRDVRAVARRHHLWGHSLRQVADGLGLKLHEVRSKLIQVQVSKGLLSAVN